WTPLSSILPGLLPPADSAHLFGRDLGGRDDRGILELEPVRLKTRDRVGGDDDRFHPRKGIGHLKELVGPEQIDARLEFLLRFEHEAAKLAVKVEMGFPARRFRSSGNACRRRWFLPVIPAVVLRPLASRHRFLLCAGGKIPRADYTAQSVTRLLTSTRLVPC